MTDHRVIVTGGGGGLGRAIARRFARDGAQVLVTGRTRETLDETASGEPSITPFPADLRREEDARAVIARAAELWGRLTLLVNNAGIFRPGKLDETTEADARDIWETNVLGPVLLTRESLPLLRLGPGSIVNISSTLGQKAGPAVGQYAASKAALDHLTRVWALELAADGIRVNAVSPGPTETGILERSGLPAELIDQLKRDDCARIPLCRRGTPEEVAEWVVRLADPASSWVTGIVIPVDGGLGIT